jgi:hypothetical protein
MAETQPAYVAFDDSKGAPSSPPNDRKSVEFSTKDLLDRTQWTNHFRRHVNVAIFFSAVCFTGKCPFAGNFRDLLERCLYYGGEITYHWRMFEIARDEGFVE